MCPHIRPPRAVSQPQNSACAYVRARLRAIGVGFRAGGRAVKLGRKRRVSKREIESCRALSKRGRRINDRGISLDDTSHLKTQVGVVGHGGHPEDTGISPGQGAVSWGHRVPGHAGVSSGYGVPRIPRCPGTPYPEDTGGILGKPRYSEDTSGVLGIPYPQDTDGILRIPRCPEDTAGVLRCLNREDAPVS